MFEKFTEKARKTIFFARHEVTECGAQSIEPAHLLLGLLRVDQALIARSLSGRASLDEIRQQLEGRMARGERIPAHVEVPLSDDAKGALKYAAEESEGLSHWHIGTGHLLLGLLRLKDSMAGEVLRGCGVDIAEVRRQVVSDTEKG